MDICDILFAEYRTPSRHRASSIKDRLPEQDVQFQNRILGEPRSHAAHRAASMTGLAIVLEDSCSSRRDAYDGTLCLRLLLQGFAFPDLVTQRRHIGRRIRMIASR